MTRSKMALPQVVSWDEWLVARKKFLAKEKIKPFKARMGWTVPWYFSFGSDFNYDFDVTTDAGETNGLSVFLREGEIK